MREQRSMERFGLELKARVSLKNNDRNRKWVNVLTSNICAGGTFLLTRQPFPVGTKVNLEVVLPLREKKSSLKDSLIKISGMVIRTEEAGMALRFDDEYQILPLAGPVLH
jgi:Tfp pilus assembly protein PilZ